MMQKAIVNALVVIIVVFAGMMSTVIGSEISYDGTWVGNTSYGDVVWFNVSEGMIKNFTISTKVACADLTNRNKWRKFGKCSGNLIITHSTFNDTYDFDNYSIPFKNPNFTFYDSTGEVISEITRVTSGVFTPFRATFIKVAIVQNRFEYSKLHHVKNIEGTCTPTKVFFYNPMERKISKIVTVSEGDIFVSYFDEPVKEAILMNATEIQSNCPLPQHETIEGVFTSAKKANGTWRLEMDSKVYPNLICVYPLITWTATKVYAPTETPTPITPPEGKEVEVPSPAFKPSPTPTVTPVPLTPTPIPAPSTTAPATEIPTPEEKGVQGFEVIFAIAGLLAVAYLLRRRK